MTITVQPFAAAVAGRVGAFIVLVTYQCNDDILRSENARLGAK